MCKPQFISKASLCSFAILLLSAATSVRAQSGSDSDFDFPYQAIVRTTDTKIFSGPASVHYATDKLAQGEIVQVYRHDPGGWCAIRPNNGSFSLIPEAALEIIDDGIGEITQDNTQAWVGTRLGSVDKPLWQIKLKAGERVEILGEASWPNPDGHSNIWYQIAPPAGEFRWVRLGDLQTPPTDTRPAADARTSSFASNTTDSRFKYKKLSKAEPAEANSSQSEPDAEETIESNFEYVQIQPQKSAPPNENSTTPVPDRLADVGAANQPPVIEPSANASSTTPRSTIPRSIKGRVESGTQWSKSVREIPPNETPPRLAARDRDTSQRPRATPPAVESQEGIDFKFRPIGQTASLKGRFESKPQESIIRDSAVAPAAYQSPVYDSNDSSNFADQQHDNYSASTGQFSSNESTWRRGRSELAQRKSQYEAKYDQFNDQIQIDRREIEESFGVQIEDLPEHPREHRFQQYNGGTYNNGLYNSGPVSSAPYSSDPHVNVGSYDNFQRYDNRGHYQVVPESSHPTVDRFASLDPKIDTHPHSRLPEKLTPRLAKIEAQLTNEMLKRPNEWQLADIELSVGQIYSQTTNPVERLQSQRIMDKITKWKVIRNGYTKTFQASGETFGTSVRSLADASNSRRARFALGDNSFGAPPYTAPTLALPQQTIGSGVNTDFELNARFDASGWLTELVSEDRNNRPVYVLVDDSGRITHHVAGVPGLNLHRYLKSKVGLSGRQGYNNRMKLDHITVASIDELQR